MILFEICIFLNQIEEEIDSRTIQVDEANKAILEEYLRLEQEYKKEQEELAKKESKNSSSNSNNSC